MKFLEISPTQKFDSLSLSLLRSSLMKRDQECTFDRAIWNKLASQGLFSFGREHQNLNLIELAQVFYKLAETSLDIPLVCTFAAQSVVARELLLHCGTEKQIADYLPQIENGSVIAAVCNSETGAGTDLKKMKAECAISTSGQSTFRFHKPCVTNGDGSLFFVSAWKKEEGKKPYVSVFIVEGNEVETKNVTSDLSGFRTGLTGSVLGDISHFPHAEREFTRNSFDIFRHCFNIERLFIGVIVAGAMRGLEKEACAVLSERGETIREQWLQEKLVTIASTRVKLDALIESLLRSDLSKSSAELGVLKLLVNEDAFNASTAFLELCGHRAISNSHLAQKFVRDLTALRFFGGTNELQKMSLFAEILNSNLPTKISQAG